MQKLLSKIKNWDDKKFNLFVFSIFFIQPILELDFWLGEYTNITRPSTIFHYIVIPILILLTYIKYEDNKKKVGIITFIYLAIVGIYFILHSINAVNIYDDLYLTTNFYFSYFQEAVYIITLILPYFLIYTFYKANIDKETIKKAILIVSFTISLLIVLGDLFLFGLSTYNGTFTKANFFTWFNGIYDSLHPRDVSSKFFYPEGNTLGIYLFIILFINYYYLLTGKDKKEKIFFTITIIIQSLAMAILGTKVATYGAILVPFASLCVMLLFVILKKIKFSLNYLLTSGIIGIVLLLMLPYTPAYVNSKLNNENNVALLTNTSDLLKKAKDELDKALVPGTAEYNYYYIHYFEDWGIKSKLISSIPSEYYLLYYQYTFDGKFWWDVLDLHPLEERCNGRQMQTIFNDYKWSSTNTYTKLMGMGYSTFMNGSFLIERDFVQQRYTLGYLGDFITMSPWIFIALYGVYKIIKDFSNKFNVKVVFFALAYLACLGSAITSGHTLDQYLTTTLMSLVSAVLLLEVNK